MEDSEFGGVTEFEFKTVMGFEAWRRCNCRAVALEVGLGGRLDATNVVQPAVCGIVSIGLDHTSILGPTEDVIASEKAGIIKPGVPVVMGILSPPARESVLRRAREMNSQVWEVGVDIVIDGDLVTTPVGSVTGVRPSLGGKWQMHNAALAIGMLHAAGIDSDSLTEGIATAVAPGRFEVRHRAGNVIVLDGAHNGSAGASLVETLRQRFGDTRFTLITNMLVGHQIEDFYSVFDGIVDEVIVAPIFNSRARSTAEVREELGHLFPNARAVNSVAEAFALSEKGPILVTGSNYLVGDAIRFLDGET
jgi:dihydrofolate synthase/folylpolyglutamate synthase